MDTSKKVFLAAPRGYCAGVDRAVDAVEKALELYGAPIYVRKEIVHNKFVVESLREKGAIFVEETDEVPQGARVVFSAHGVSPQVHVQAEHRKLLTIDATCPLVTKVHREAIRFAKADHDIILIGHKGHEEVEGTQGEAPDHIQVVSSEEEIENLVVRDENKVVWISQTTLSVDETNELVEKLRNRFPNLIDPPSCDICYATSNRQMAVKEIARKCDVLIVVGSSNSSNSVRLVEVGKEAGVEFAYRIDKASEVDPAWIENAMSIGVTSGASVPEILVQDLLSLLAEYGFKDVETLECAEEKMTFSLPKNLQSDLKAAGSNDPKLFRKSSTRNVSQ